MTKNLYKDLTKIHEDFENLIYVSADEDESNKMLEIRLAHFDLIYDEMKNFFQDNKIIEIIKPKKQKTNLIHSDHEKFIDKTIRNYIMNEYIDRKILVTQENLNQFNEIKAIFMKLYEIEYELKKLWEKPKSIINCNYVISLSELNEELRKKILENIPKEQEEEWKKLFFTKEEYDLEKIKKDEKYKNIPIDTKHFDEVMVYEILSSFEDINNKANGILICGDNWQAMNYLKNHYAS